MPGSARHTRAPTKSVAPRIRRLRARLSGSDSWRNVPHFQIAGRLLSLDPPMILKAGSRSPRSDPPLSLPGGCTYQVQSSTAPIRALTCPNTDKPEKASVDRGLGFLTEDVLEEESQPRRRFLFRENILYQCEDLGHGVQVENLGELLDVLCVAGPCGERLHREEMFR